MSSAPSLWWIVTIWFGLSILTVAGLSLIFRIEPRDNTADEKPDESLDKHTKTA